MKEVGERVTEGSPAFQRRGATTFRSRRSPPPSVGGRWAAAAITSDRKTVASPPRCSGRGSVLFAQEEAQVRPERNAMKDAFVHHACLLAFVSQVVRSFMEEPPCSPANERVVAPLVCAVRRQRTRQVDCWSTHLRHFDGRAMKFLERARTRTQDYNS